MTEKLPFLDITLLVLILLSISALGFMFIVWLLRRKYARNRFAFAGLSAIVFLSMTILSSLPFRSTPWDVVGTLFAYTFNVPYVPSEPRLVDYIFVLLVLSIVVYVILQLYKNWDGQITVEQYSREARYEPTTLVADGLDEIKRLLQRSPPPPIHQPTEVRPLESTLIPADESLAWHIRACDLVSLRTPSYTFVRHEDWHEQHRSWIGYNRRTDALVGIFCVNEDPSTHDIDTFVNYARRMARNQKRNQNEIELIIALEQSESIDPVEVYGIVVRKETEDTLLTGLVDFTDYFNHIRRRAERDFLPDSGLTLSDMYVPSKIRQAKDITIVKENVEEYLGHWLVEEGQRQLALLGEYGQGKSTAALMFVHHIVGRKSKELKRVPPILHQRGC